MKIEPRGYNLSCLKDDNVKVPEKGKKSCLGSSYYGHSYGITYQVTSERLLSDIFKEKLKELVRLAQEGRHWRVTIVEACNAVQVIVGAGSDWVIGGLPGVDDKVNESEKQSIDPHA